MELKEFLEEIASGSRVSGTEGEQRALDYLEEYVERIGFSVKREDFSFQASLPQESYLEVGGVRYEVLPVGYSESGEVSGHIAFMESLESKMIEVFRDCIAVYPDDFYERSTYESLLSSDIDAVVLALGAALCRLVDAPSYRMFWERWLESGKIVAATIGRRNLYGIAPRDEATLVSKSEERLVSSANLVWDLDVDGKEDIYIFAHHDSVPYSWGVTDNAC